jgi:hypothetical protein
MTNNQEKIEIHHHYLTDDPQEAFATKKKYVFFRHEKYGPQNVRMTPKFLADHVGRWTSGALSGAGSNV